MLKLKVKILYVINYLTNILINFDHGILPACTQEIKKELQIDEIELGTLGSAVYAGLVMGSVAGASIFTLIKTKKIVYTSVFCCICSLILFLLTRNYYLLVISRFSVGFFQMFLIVFFPVWIDFFGGKLKTLWLTFMQLGVALGAVIGYLATSLFISHSSGWQNAYELQIILLIPCLLSYILFDETYIDTSGNDQLSNQVDQINGAKRKNFYELLRELLSNRVYIYTILTLSTLFFVVNGIQFWISDYLRTVLKVPQRIVFKAYLSVAVTGPVLGVVLGGIILHYTGGYDGKNALRLATMEALLAALSGTSIPFLNNFWLVLMDIWFLLFFGGSLVPAVMGIMINSIPKSYRSSGNSLAHIFQELFGYLPSPVLYGLVQQLTGGATSRWGMVLLVSWSYLGLIFIHLASRNKKAIELMEIQNLKNKVIELDQIMDGQSKKDQLEMKLINSQKDFNKYSINDIKTLENE